MRTREEIEARMLSGEPFSYGPLCHVRKMAIMEDSGDIVRDGDHDRLIDRTIQKLRRKGLIAFERKAGRVIWTATTPEDGGA